MAAKSTKRTTVKRRRQTTRGPKGVQVVEAPAMVVAKPLIGEKGPEIIALPASAKMIANSNPLKDPWYRSILTDHNGDFDMGAVLVGVVAIFMCINAGYDTITLHSKFNAQEFGIGIAAMLGGFAAYKWGDSKRPTGDSSSTTTVVQTTTAKE